MKTILAPTDFSNSSLNAVNYAADLALSINAKLVLFHAIPFPIAISEISIPGDVIDDMMDVDRRDMDDLHKILEDRTRGKIIITTDVKIGNAEQEIENICLKEKPLAIVMGIRSGKSLERAIMGSSVFHIMNHVAFPTLIIPENVIYSDIKNIGLLCDLQKTGEQLPIEAIMEWLFLFKGRLDIINISARDKEFNIDQSIESIAIQKRLNAFNPAFHWLTSDDIAEEINEFVKTHPLDLLMVFPGKHGIFRIFHKKKSRFIATHNELPVLSIHKLSLKPNA
jgi:nucleotide-binding universal stress UspA family protein